VDIEVARLVTRLIAETGQYQSALEQAQDITGQASKQIEQATQRIETAVRSKMGAASGAVESLSDSLDDLISSQNKQSDSMRKVGETVEDARGSMDQLGKIADDASGAMASTGTSLNNVGTLASGAHDAFRGLGQVIGQVAIAYIAFRGELALSSGFLEYEKSTTRLRSVIQANGGDVGQAMQRYADFAKSMSKISTVSRGAVRDMIQQAEVYGLTGRAAEAVVRQSVFLGAAKGQEAQAFLLASIQMQRGNNSLMQRALRLRDVKDEEDLLRKVQEMSSRGMVAAAAATKTYSHQIEEMQRAVKLLGIEFGEVIVAGAGPLMAVVHGTVEGFLGLSGTIKTVIYSLFGLGAAMAVLVPLKKAWTLLFSGTGASIKGTIAWIGKLAGVAKTGVVSIAGAVVTVTGGVLLAAAAIGSLVGEIPRLWGGKGYGIISLIQEWNKYNAAIGRSKEQVIGLTQRTDKYYDAIAGRKFETPAGLAMPEERRMFLTKELARAQIELAGAESNLAANTAAGYSDLIAAAQARVDSIKAGISKIEEALKKEETQAEANAKAYKEMLAGLDVKIAEHGLSEIDKQIKEIERSLKRVLTTREVAEIKAKLIIVKEKEFSAKIAEKFGDLNFQIGLTGLNEVESEVAKFRREIDKARQEAGLAVLPPGDVFQQDQHLTQLLQQQKFQQELSQITTNTQIAGLSEIDAALFQLRERFGLNEDQIIRLRQALALLDAAKSFAGLKQDIKKSSDALEDQLFILQQMPTVESSIASLYARINREGQAMTANERVQLRQRLALVRQLEEQVSLQKEARELTRRFDPTIEYREKLARLQQMQAQGLITPGIFQRAFAELAEGLNTATDATGSLREEMARLDATIVGTMNHIQQLHDWSRRMDIFRRLRVTPEAQGAEAKVGAPEVAGVVDEIMVVADEIMGRIEPPRVPRVEVAGVADEVMAVVAEIMAVAREIKGKIETPLMPIGQIETPPIGFAQETLANLAQQFQGVMLDAQVASGREQIQVVGMVQQLETGIHDLVHSIHQAQTVGQDTSVLDQLLRQQEAALAQALERLRNMPGYREFQEGITGTGWQGTTPAVNLDQLIRHLTHFINQARPLNQMAEQATHPGSIYVHDIAVEKALQNIMPDTQATAEWPKEGADLLEYAGSWYRESERTMERLGEWYKESARMMFAGKEFLKEAAKWFRRFAFPEAAVAASLAGIPIAAKGLAVIGKLGTPIAKGVEVVSGLQSKADRTIADLVEVPEGIEAMLIKGRSNLFGGISLMLPQLIATTRTMRGKFTAKEQPIAMPQKIGEQAARMIEPRQADFRLQAVSPQIEKTVSAISKQSANTIWQETAIRGTINDWVTGTNASISDYLSSQTQHRDTLRDVSRYSGHANQQAFAVQQEAASDLETIYADTVNLLADNLALELEGEDGVMVKAEYAVQLKGKAYEQEMVEILRQIVTELRDQPRKLERGIKYPSANFLA